MSTLTPDAPQLEQHPPAPPAAGRSDAEKVRRAMRATPPKPRKGARTRPRAPERPADDTPAPAPVDEGEREFWGRQLQSLFDSIAAFRGPQWKMPDQVRDAAGEPAALCARKYLPEVSDRPELVLATVLVPFILSAVRVELVKWTEARQTRGGGERRDIRPQGLGQDDAREDLATAPFPSSGD